MTNIGLATSVDIDADYDCEAKEINIKAVVIVDSDGNYFIHGTSNAQPHEMFQTMSPLWNLNPEKESIHVINFTLQLPKIEGPFVK